MCREEFKKCPYCQYQRHIHWNHCNLYMRELTIGVKTMQDPLPKPDDCPNRYSFVKMYLGALTCPVENCLTTKLKPGKLADVAQELAEHRADMAAKNARREARKQRFADRYFQRVPIVRRSSVSLLAEGIARLRWLAYETDDECAIFDEEEEDEEALAAQSASLPIKTKQTEEMAP